VAAADLHAHGPERKIQIIMDHNEIGYGPVSDPQDRRHRPSAVGHLRLRLGKNRGLGINASFPDQSVVFILRNINMQVLASSSRAMKPAL